MVGVIRPWFVLVSILAVSSTALAAPTKEEIAKATELKKKGDDQSHNSQFKDAIASYDASFAIVPDPAIHYNKARALQQLGEFPEALAEMHEFEKAAPPALKAKVPLAKLLEEIEHNIATVTIQCEVAGATVVINDKDVGTTPISTPIQVKSGDASIIVKADGYVAYTSARDLPGGETTNVEVKLVPAAKPTPTPEPVPDNTPPPQKDTSGPPSRSWRMITITSGAVGLASLGTGLVFFGLAMGDKSTVDAHCPMKACDAQGRSALNDAQTFATVSTVFVVVGAVGLAAAATTFLVTPKKSDVQARLQLGPGYVGLGGTFR
jgi:hypothetical protein